MLGQQDAIMGQQDVKIGSNAQCRLIKVAAIGLKNELTNYRTME